MVGLRDGMIDIGLVRYPVPNHPTVATAVL